MAQPEVRVVPEIKCGDCDHISEVEVMEGPGERFFRHHECPNCNADYEITLEIEWFDN